MGRLIREHARYAVSDLGLHAALRGPLGPPPASFDLRRPQRALLAEVLASCDTGHAGVLDLVYKQANLRHDEVRVLVERFGPPDRVTFCLRDPAGFMQSAIRKFPDIDVDMLREVNYLGTIAEHERIGGDVFVYHPQVTGEEYARFLRPLTLTTAQLASVRYTGSAAPNLTTPQMWEAYRRLAATGANQEGVSATAP